MNILISVCGRAGSTGFPGKNLADFLGVPLYRYSLAAAKLFAQVCGATADICVSSDSSQLLEGSVQFFDDISVINRPEYLCDNVVPKLAVFTHALKVIEEKFGIKYDYYIDLDITSPLRRVCDIQNALQKKIKSQDIQVIFSAVHSRRNPYYNMVTLGSDGRVTKAIEKERFFARQQVVETYDINASIYVFDADFIRDNTSNYIWDALCGISLMKDTGVLDIDSKEDFELMQAIAKHLIATDEEFCSVYEKAVGGAV